MVQAARTAFPHRHNPDGSIDSICSECFRTVATAFTEAQLQAAERVHGCEGFSMVALYHRHRTEDERRQAAEG
jgi:hypothetical protein